MNYIEQAYKGENKLWMFIVTSILVGGVFIQGLYTFFTSSAEDYDQMAKMLDHLPKLSILAVNLLPFVFLLLILFFLVKMLHRRSILSFSTSRDKFDFKRFFFSLSVIFSITIFSFVVSYIMEPDNFELQFDLAKFLPLFIVSLVLFPFQIGLEEYLFRGYWMQQMGIMSKNRWFPLVMTSFLFGVFHSANPEVAEMGYITMVYYMGTGLLLGVLTLMDQGLELALGFHFGNNFLAATLVTYKWSALQTDAIFSYVPEQADNTFYDIVLPVLIMYPIIIFIFSKKYGWTNWKDKLIGSIDKY